MAERRPPGFNVDLGFYDSDEVLSIPRKIRAAAIGVWTLCGAYSANKLTDGYVSTEALKDRGCTPAIRSALMSTTPQPLWESAPDTGDVGAIRFTRWPKWQRTSAEVKAYREADAERKRKAREARKAPETSDDSEMSERIPDGRSQTVRSDSGTPKTKTKTETDLKNSGSEPSNQDLGRSPNGSRGSRLPADWMPAPDVVAQMRSDHPHIDLKAEHAKFSDHWHDQPGAKGRKVDWTGTWRNWIRRAAEQQPARAAPHVNGTANGHDTKVNDYLAFANQPQQRELEQ